MLYRGCEGEGGVETGPPTGPSGAELLEEIEDKRKNGSGQFAGARTGQSAVRGVLYSSCLHINRHRQYQDV